MSRSAHGRRAILVAALFGACASPPESQPRPNPLQALMPVTVDDLAQRELETGALGFVVGLYHAGAIQYLKAWGHASLESTQPLSPDALFPFATLTEVLVAATARGLSATKVLDTEAEIGLYIRELPEGLARITLGQLLTHTSGLDNVPVEEGEDWSTVLDELPDRALFTDPGLIYSRSPYSYPLAIRVLERVTGEPIQQLVTRALLEPLGMDRTTFDLDEAGALGLVQEYRRSRDDSLPPDPDAPLEAVEPVDELNGMPVVFTTVRDVTQLLATMGAGGLRGESPFGQGPVGPDVLGGRHFRDGFWIEDYRGAPSAYRTGGGGRLRILSATNTIVVGWGSGGPAPTENLVLSRTADFLGLPSEAPRRQTSFAEPTRFTDPDIRDWVGDYLNGQFIFALREIDGGVAFYDGDKYLPVELLQSGVYAGRIEDGRIGVRFSLYEIEGWRIAFRGASAYARRPATQ